MVDEVDRIVKDARQNGVADLIRRSASRFPGKTAIVYRDLRQTYADLDDMINRTANALISRGVAKGDRVAMLSHNNHAFVVVHFALARIGAISVPINFMLMPSEVAYVLQHSGVVGMVVEGSLIAVAESALSTDASTARQLKVRGVIEDAAGQACGGWESVSAWTAWPEPRAPDVLVDDDDVIQLMYTSGTESRPKGAALSSRSLVANYTSCAIDGRMEGGDVEVHALPLYHCAQMHCFLTPSLMLGATNILLAGAEPGELLATIERESASKLFCPPTVWISLLRHPQLESYDLSSLRKGYYGASVMPVEVLKEISERLPDVSLFNFYGQTEMAPVATVLLPEDQVRKAGSAGRPVVNVETLVVDEDDMPLPPGTVGEIVHRSPQAMLGYWNDPEKTADAFRNGWFHSGDLGVVDEDGYLTIVDRKKDMIKSGGENVASREVEEIIFQHPAVSEVAVFGAPDPKWIEAVTAAVVLREEGSISPTEIIEFCRERLAGFKVPKTVAVVDSLPKNASGKVLKRELRDRIGSPLG